MGLFMGQADGHEHVGGIQGSRRTGAARGPVDSRPVEVEEKGFPFDTDEAEVGVVRKTLSGRRPVQFRVGDGLHHALHQHVPQHADPRRGRIHPAGRQLDGGTQADDPGHVLRGGPPPSFLSPAVHEVVDPDTLPDVEGADALGSVKLMGRKGQEIDVHGLHVDGDMGHSLNRVRMEQDPLFPAEGADLRHGLQRPDLVVGEHHRHENCFVRHGLFQLVQADAAFGVHIEKGHVKAVLLEELGSVEHGMMLYLRGDHMVAL